MFIHYRTQGIILKKTDLAEADQLLTIYTQDFGKLEILAKGIRKITAKLRPATELFCWSEIEFIQGKQQKKLTDALLINHFPKIKKDLLKLTLASEIGQTVDELIKEQETDERMWLWLKTIFQKLNNLNLNQSLGLKLYFYFFWHFIALLGYQPELNLCHFCQRKIKTGKVYFSFRDGGLICQNCQKKIKLVQEINPDLIKILRIIFKQNWSFLAKIKLTQKHFLVLGQLSQQIKKFLTHL